MIWMSMRHRLENLEKLITENHIAVIVGDDQTMAHHKSKHWGIIRNYKCNPCCFLPVVSIWCATFLFYNINPNNLPDGGISSFIQQCRWLYITNASHKGMKRHWKTGTNHIFFKLVALSNERFQWPIAIPTPFWTTPFFSIDCRTPTQTSLPPIFTQKTTWERTHLRESV